MYAHNQSSAIK